MGVKMGWIQIKMCHPLAQNGAALAPFRANGAHPSDIKQLLATNSLLRMRRVKLTVKEREEDFFFSHWGFNPELYAKQKAL